MDAFAFAARMLFTFDLNLPIVCCVSNAFNRPSSSLSLNPPGGREDSSPLLAAPLLSTDGTRGLEI